MLTFELSAIDLILTIAVVVLLLMYITKLEPKYPDQTSLLKEIKKSKESKNQKSCLENNYTECPRGFGNIRKIGDNNSISERCLGCYRLVECYK